MALKNTELLLRWTRSPPATISHQRIQLNDRLMDVTTQHFATNKAIYHIDSLQPLVHASVCGAWVNQPKRIMLGREERIFDTVYDDSIKAHISFDAKNNRIMTEAMPMFIEKDFMVLCGSNVLINGTLVSTEGRTPSCGDVKDNLALVGTLEGDVLVYDITEATIVKVYRTVSPITAIRSDDLTSLFATGHHDGIIRMHMLSPRTLKTEQVLVKDYHRSPIRRIRICSHRMASTDDSGVVMVASPAGNKVWWAHTCHDHMVDISPTRAVIGNGKFLHVLNF